MKGQGQMCMLHIYISYLAGNYNQQKAHCLIEVIVQGQMCMLHIYISYLAGNYNQQKAHCLIDGHSPRSNVYVAHLHFLLSWKLQSTKSALFNWARL